MSVQLGLAPREVFTASQLKTEQRGFGVNDYAMDHSGNEYVFVLAGAGGITGDGFVARYDAAGTAVMLSTANDARGDRVGVARAAIPAGSYGWLQVRGNGTVRVLASALANTRLNTTATAGALDDDGTVGSMHVEGIYLTTANGGAAGAVAATINQPFVSVTI